MRRFLKIFVPILLVVLICAYIFWSAPTVSVIMATYNREDLVGAAIGSVLRQTLPDFEFIIIDDASTDKTPDIVQRYADKDDRIIFIRNTENKGLVHNLNKALDIARGKYIARMDDDDISLPMRLRRQIEFLNTHPDTTVLGSWIAPIGSLKPYPFHRVSNPEYFKIEMYYGSTPISHPSIVIRHDFLKKHKIRYSEKYKYVEDAQLYADILAAGGLIHALPEVLLQYRFMQSNKPSNYYVEQKDNAIKLYAERFKDFYPSITRVEFQEMGYCDRLLAMRKANAQKHILKEKELNDYVGWICGKSSNNH